MVIRKLTEKDAAALWNLRMCGLETEPSSFAESPEELQKTSIEEYAQRLGTGGDENFVFGALDGGNFVGMTGFYLEKQMKLRHKGNIWGVFVAPSVRGTGVGRGLMTAVIESARKLPGIRCILLKVVSSNTSARQLYASLGFRSFGTESRSLRVGDRYFDEDHMRLELLAGTEVP